MKYVCLSMNTMCLFILLKKQLRLGDACVVSHQVINELDGLKKDFQPYKYNNLQHAQYVLENARSVEK